MRYTKPQLLTTVVATSAIQQVTHFGSKPIGPYQDRSLNACTLNAYDADE